MRQKSKHMHWIPNRQTQFSASIHKKHNCLGLRNYREPEIIYSMKDENNFIICPGAGGTTLRIICGGWNLFNGYFFG